MKCIIKVLSLYFHFLRKDKRDILLRNMRKNNNSIINVNLRALFFILARFQLKLIVLIFKKKTS